MTTSKHTRSFRAYCVGHARSGTASVHGVCQTSFRSAHEPEISELLKRILLAANGPTGRDGLLSYIGDRDTRLGLDCDSSWANHFLMSDLAKAFPDAQFILLIRDCYTWVESLINHMLTVEIPANVRAFAEWWFQPQKHPYGRGERLLEERGLFSIGCYLTCWRTHVTRSCASVPSHRMLIIRTHEMRQSLDDLARFLHIPREQLDDTNCHLNRGTREARITSLIDHTFLEEAVDSICGDMMRRHFPEIRCIDDAYALRGRSR